MQAIGETVSDFILSSFLMNLIATKYLAIGHSVRLVYRFYSKIRFEFLRVTPIITKERHYPTESIEPRNAL